MCVSLSHQCIVTVSLETKLFFCRKSLWSPHRAWVCKIMKACSRCKPFSTFQTLLSKLLVYMQENLAFFMVQRMHSYANMHCKYITFFFCTLFLFSNHMKIMIYIIILLLLLYLVWNNVPIISSAKTVAITVYFGHVSFRARNVSFLNLSRW